MRSVLKILRRDRGDNRSHWQCFEYESQSESDTVAAALNSINSRNKLVDINGAPARAIEWEHSCLQKKCGACAMVINGKPCLACGTKLSELGSGCITIQPLKKFPVICDLVVDRSILFENLKRMRAWLENDPYLSEGFQDLAYESSECIQCGCCLEVCPNFYTGGSFFGMSVLPVTMRIISESAEYRELSKLYSKHIYNGCGKSLACKKICPKGIDTEKMLVNANILAVWKRKKR